MQKISFPGKTDRGSILLDVLMSLFIVSISIIPLYRAGMGLKKSNHSYQVSLAEIIQLQNVPRILMVERETDE